MCRIRSKKQEDMVLNSAYANRFVGEGLTFDDVLLVPAESSVVPRDVNKSRLRQKGGC